MILRTYTGRDFVLDAPSRRDVSILDIAWALSRICRFGGHVLAPHYSVAEHSVRVSRVVRDGGGTPAEVLHALLHDAAEAYIGDVVWPLKHLPEMAGYRALEARVEAEVFASFGLPPELPAVVKRADLILLATEKRDLVRRHGDPSPSVRPEVAAASVRLGVWACDGFEPLLLPIIPVDAGRARDEFLRAYDDAAAAYDDAAKEE